MIPCSKNHVPIWHEERFCPLCTAINLVEVERMYLENLKKAKNEREIYMEGNFKYTSREVEQIVLEYHIKQMPPPVGMVWVATEKTYGGVSIDLISKEKETGEIA